MTIPQPYKFSLTVVPDFFVEFSKNCIPDARTLQYLLCDVMEHYVKAVGDPREYIERKYPRDVCTWMDDEARKKRVDEIACKLAIVGDMQIALGEGHFMVETTQPWDTYRALSEIAAQKHQEGTQHE